MTTSSDDSVPTEGGPDVLFVVGSHPEVVKLAPVVRRLPGRARIVHTGQHDAPELSERFWDAMMPAPPEAVLGVGSGSRGARLAAALDALDRIVCADRPHAVVVQGGTHAAVAGALVANAHRIPLVHVDAGTRSHDRALPEEHHRVVVDHLADVLCAPTWENVDNLLAEGLPVDRVHLTGSTVVDAVRGQLPTPQHAAGVLQSHGVTEGRYVVATIHHPEYADGPAPTTIPSELVTILSELAAIEVPVLVWLDPRTRERVATSGIEHLLGPLHRCDPPAPADLLALCEGAAAVVSDAGGLQEECSVLKRPLLVVGGSTERHEVIGTFAERCLPGPDISRIVNRWVADVAGTRQRLSGIPSPYGTERSTDSIARLVEAAADAGRPEPPTSAS